MTEAGSDFFELRARKRSVTELARHQFAALQVFHDGDDLTSMDGRIKVGHFALERKRVGDGHLSITSSSTCIRSLLSSPALSVDLDYSTPLADLDERYRQEKLTTGDLEHGNVYTLGQLLPTLRRMTPTDSRSELVDDAIHRLKGAVAAPGVGIAPFLPNGYLTYWSLVALSAWDVDVAGSKSLKWSQDELYRQLALAAAGDDEADPFQLGYTLLAVRRFASGELRESLVKAGLAALFQAQLPSGVWEKKDPLFTYGEHGDAYPFAFELLNAVLTDLPDAPGLLIPFEENLERAVEWVRRNSYGGEPPLWRSGHLADSADPESWATAEIYYFLQNFRTYLADRILAGALRETGRGRPGRPPDPQAFSRLWQAAIIDSDNKEHLIGELFVNGMLSKLSVPGGVGGQRYSLARNPDRRKRVRSGILFGPPGTGKTTYAKAIANYLGWPMITITPADFAAQGMLLIPTVGRQLFDRLLELEDTVIFFDEMEELIRTRDDGGDNFEQRFLTTSFLPSMQDLRDAASCVYLIATNHIASLDEAAQAPRRFDFQLQVRPPAHREKMKVLEREYELGGASTELAKQLNDRKEEIEWASRDETRELFEKIRAEPGKGEEIVASFKPALWDKRDELIKEAERNVIARLLEPYQAAGVPSR